VSLIKHLNDKQKEAVLTSEGPLLILAGAGSGKTRVLTHKVAYLVEEMDVDPRNILAITFTNKAAKEMKERIEKLLTSNIYNMWVSTFHSMCVRILRRDIEHIGYDRSFTIYDSSDQKNLVKETLKELDISDKNFPVNSVISRISDCKNKYISPEKFIKASEGNYRELEIGRIYKRYQKKLEKNGALDFDDLIYKTVELFKTREDILERYQTRFKYVLVDEYQDTNTLQYMLVKMLADKYKNVCVVGDDNQSIYGWRGADIRNILDFEKDFTDAKTIKLEQNYRCTGNILNAANGVIKNNLERKEKVLWTENEEGNKIKKYTATDEKDEATYIVESIQKNVREDSDEYKDHAVLYRTNAQSRAIEEKLIKKNVPYALYGGTRFYDRLEIKDILGYLKAISNNKDEIAFKRIINVPKRGIGKTTIDKVTAIANSEDITFLEVLSRASEYEELKRAKDKLLDFYDMFNKFINEKENYNIVDYVEMVIQESGYVEALERENTEESNARQDNIGELLSKVAEFNEDEANEEKTLEALLEDIALVADIDSYKENTDVVKLMTLHSAKGLEFKNVFIAGVEEGIFPSYRSIEDESQLEEERRIMYVGITRAEKKIYLTNAYSRMMYGRTSYNRESRFIFEIPKNLLSENSPVKKVAGSYETKPTNSYKISNPYVNRNLDVNKSVELHYDIGDSVAHMKFGEGVVKDIVKAGADYEVTIEFKKVGVKKLMSKFAKLKKM